MTTNNASRDATGQSLSELIALLDRRQYDPACRVELSGKEYQQLRDAALAPSTEERGELAEGMPETLEKHRVRPEWYRRGQSLAMRILDHEWQSKEDRRATLVVDVACDIRDAVEEALRSVPSSRAATELAPLPDCMIGPSEPCEGYQRLQRELNALRSARGATPACYEIDGNCPDYDKCCKAGRCLHHDNAATSTGRK